MCPIQFLDPMRSRAGQKAAPRFFNGPPKGSTRRYELRIVGGFVSIKGHFHGDQNKTLPCMGEEQCDFCRKKAEPQPYEYFGALLNGNADEPVNWCIPPDLAHYLGEPPFWGLQYTIWRRDDGTMRVERSRKAALVIDHPEIDIWRHCLASWRIPETQAGPRPKADPMPIIFQPADPEPTKPEPAGYSIVEAMKLSREDLEAMRALPWQCRADFMAKAIGRKEGAA